MELEGGLDLFSVMEEIGIYTYFIFLALLHIKIKINPFYKTHKIAVSLSLREWNFSLNDYTNKFRKIVKYFLTMLEKVILPFLWMYLYFKNHKKAAFITRFFGNE